MMKTPVRQRPVIGVYEKPFWDAVQARQFQLQCCSDCQHIWYPPGPVCPQCLSENWKMTRMSGKGRVIAWTVFHRQYFPNFEVPYLVVSVALEEGPLLIGNMVGIDDPAGLRLDLPVHAVFENVHSSDGEWILLQWERD